MITVTTGMDVDDKRHQICVLNEAGQVVRQDRVINTAAVRKCFGPYAGKRAPHLARGPAASFRQPVADIGLTFSLIFWSEVSCATSSS